MDAVEQQINRFQVVPPCGGHPGHDHRISRHGDVSSRAPVWGASCRNWKRSWRTQFQVVPPCGGHHFRSISLKPLNLFQVVPPCGGHHFLVPVCIHDHAVSSRAPVWGASGKIMEYYQKLRVSSRAPVWGASHPQATAGIRPRFQVVPPCGGHPWLWMMVELSICFKSCPRVGGILSLSLMFCFFAMFQVVPPCGGHPMASLSWPRMPMFQVVPPCGGHPLLLSSSIVAKGFKSCPRVGGIRPAPPLPGGLGGFKSCPRVGGILRRLPGSRACPVSSRAPVWGASGHS